MSFVLGTNKHSNHNNYNHMYTRNPPQSLNCQHPCVEVSCTSCKKKKMTTPLSNAMADQWHFPVLVNRQKEQKHTDIACLLSQGMHPCITDVFQVRCNHPSIKHQCRICSDVGFTASGDHFHEESAKTIDFPWLAPAQFPWWYLPQGREHAIMGMSRLLLFCDNEACEHEEQPSITSSAYLNRNISAFALGSQLSRRQLQECSVGRAVPVVPVARALATTSATASDIVSASAVAKQEMCMDTDVDTDENMNEIMNQKKNEDENKNDN